MIQLSGCVFSENVISCLCSDSVGLNSSRFWRRRASGSGFGTIRVLLVRVDDQSAVVEVVEDAVVVVIVVAVVSEAVVVRVQLGAVGDVGTVVPGVLMSISVPAEDQKTFDPETLQSLLFVAKRSNFVFEAVLSELRVSADVFGPQQDQNTRSVLLILLEPFLKWTLTGRPDFPWFWFGSRLRFGGYIRVLVGVANVSHQVVVHVRLKERRRNPVTSDRWF